MFTVNMHTHSGKIVTDEIFNKNKSFMIKCQNDVIKNYVLVLVDKVL